MLFKKHISIQDKNPTKMQSWQHKQLVTLNSPTQHELHTLMQTPSLFNKQNAMHKQSRQVFIVTRWLAF